MSNENVHPTFKTILDQISGNQDNAPKITFGQSMELTERSVALGADLLRRNQILMAGLHKILGLTLLDRNISKREITDIVVETLDKL